MSGGLFQQTNHIIRRIAHHHRAHPQVHPVKFDQTCDDCKAILRKLCTSGFAQHDLVSSGFLKKRLSTNIMSQRAMTQSKRRNEQRCVLAGTHYESGPFINNDGWEIMTACFVSQEVNILPLCTAGHILELWQKQANEDTTIALCFSERTAALMKW